MLTLSRAAGFSVQAVQLAKRELQGLWRNKPGFVATYLVPTLLNLFFALIFFQVGPTPTATPTPTPTPNPNPDPDRRIFFQVGDTTKSNYEINSHFGGMTQIAIGGMFG